MQSNYVTLSAKQKCHTPIAKASIWEEVYCSPSKDQMVGRKSNNHPYYYMTTTQFVKRLYSMGT
jgi:hypothetical protein